MTTKKHIPNSYSVNPIHVQRYTFQYIFLLKSVQKWKVKKTLRKKTDQQAIAHSTCKTEIFFL